jgi:hypothetical protein
MKNKFLEEIEEQPQKTALVNDHLRVEIKK